MGNISLEMGIMKFVYLLVGFVVYWACLYQVLIFRDSLALLFYRPTQTTATGLVISYAPLWANPITGTIYYCNFPDRVIDGKWKTYGWR